MTDILSHDATDQLRALETKAISAVELLDAAVGRYEATHAQLNAVVATDLERARQRARDGLTGPRTEGTIGFSVVRGGGIVGEHSVTFAAEDEILTLSHSARDRGLFARGALAAARWVAGQPAGEYDMQDVLGFAKS